MKPQVVAALLLAIGFEIATLAAPAWAGECFGMINYEYSAGECIDRDGDTSGALSTMWDDSYHQQQSMIQQSKRMFTSGASAGTGNGSGMRARRGYVPTANEQYALSLTLVTHMRNPSDMAAKITAAIPATSPRERRLAQKFLLRSINDFTAYGPRLGYRAFDIASARVFFLRSAYGVYNGDHVADRLAAAVLNSVVSYPLITRSLIPQMTDLEKRRLYDSYIIYAVALGSQYRESRQRHDARSIASTRAAARRLIEGDIGVDPAKVRIDQLPCVSSPLPGFSCDQIVQWYRSGGVRN